MGKTVNAGEFKRDDLFHVLPEDVIVKPEENGRKFEPDLTALILSILDKGKVLVPVQTRKVHENRIQLTAGYGRHSAVTFINTHLTDGVLENLLKQADMEHVKVPTQPLRLPCVVSNINAEEAFLHNIAENRARNRTTAVDDAQNIRRLTEQYNKSDVEICRIYGENGKPMSPAWLSQMRKINTLSDEIQQQIHNGELSKAIAFALADMPEEARAEVLELAKATRQEIDGEDAKVTLTDVVKAGRKKKAITKTVGRKMAELRELLETQNGPGNGLHCRRFVEALLGWIDGSVEDEAMLKEFGRRFKE